MKRLLIAFAAIVAAAVSADEPVVAATIRADGSTNMWTQADLQAALGLVNRMYWRDQETDAGRRKWHGERIGQYVLPTGETNAAGKAILVNVMLYADGFVMSNRAVRAKNSLVKDPEAAAKAKRRAEDARRAWEQANLPPDLAALRAAQRLASTTQDVTVIVGP